MEMDNVTEAERAAVDRLFAEGASQTTRPFQ